MFLYNKSVETTGTLYYENYATPKMASGYKTVATDAHITGTGRFAIAKRDKRIIPTDDGRSIVDTVIAQFGWDEIDRLNDTGIQFIPGALKLEYDNVTYRLTDKDTFGLSYDWGYRPVGIIEAVFRRMRSIVEDAD